MENLCIGLPSFYFYNVKSECGGYRLDKIIRAVSRYSSIRPMDLKSSRRGVKLTRFRHISYYLCRVLTGLSMEVVGRIFGGRDHSTIVYGVRKMERMILKDADLAHDVALLIWEITGEQQ